MNEFLSSAASKLNPLIGIVITLAGALVGGKLAGDAPLGVLLGIVAGSAVALALCGSVAMLSQVVGAIEQPAAQAGAASGYAAAPVHSGVHVNGAAGAAKSSKEADDLAAAQAAIRASSGDLDAALANVDAALAEYIRVGDFSGFHLHKAKKAMAEGNYKDAVYQARASLSHDPSNTEARQVRAAAGKQR